MIHPVVCNPVLSPLVGTLNPPRWRAGLNAPLDSILRWDASRGWQDQTGNQSLTLIGSAYPTVSASGALNEWGFDLGAVRTAFLAGEMTLVFQATMPAMTEFTDATDYSLFGDLLFVRRDGAVGTFKLSDGTPLAAVAYDWDEGEVVTVVCQCSGARMRVGIIKADLADYILNFKGEPLQYDGDNLYWGAS